MVVDVDMELDVLVELLVEVVEVDVLVVVPV